MAIEQPLDEATFSQLVDKTRLKPRGRQMARAILVQGRRPSEVGQAFGVTRQAAETTALRVLDRLRAEGIKRDWITTSVLCSPKLGELVRYLAAYEQAEAGMRKEPPVPELSNEIVEMAAKALSQWAKQ